MLKGQAAVITGSTSGIGRGIAERLAAAGCNVMLNGFGEADAIEQLRAGLERDHGVQVRYCGADMARPDEIADMIQDTARDLGSVDILVNNAGIQHVAPVDEFPIGKWDAILAINLSSSFHSIRAALPHMKAAGRGRIVNIASAHGLRASPYKAAYVAAKHGVLGLTKTVALEVAEQNITCNAICPGYVRTPLVDGQIDDTARARGISPETVIRDVILHAQPTKQFVTVEQIGELVVFLCGETGASITGAALSMDGGWTAK
ncbi:MAG: 3-hydroxybutyrate dehydrogenase [Candidatus Competibacterales bacterium]|nr:3-hydroxybutyrate dehydrogenase [Candidatus Competibacterales bacterium]